VRGTVIKRGPGRYSVVLDLGRGPDGKRLRRWHSGYTTKKAAEAVRVELLARQQHGEYVDPSTLTLAEFLDRWLEYMTSIGRDARTVERHGELARLHVTPYLGGVRLQQLAPTHLADLYARLLREGRRDGRPGGLAPRTVGHVHRTIHRALRQAVRWQLLARNPASDLELPTVPKAEMVTLTREQARTLLEAAAERPLMRSLVMLGVATGARLGELLALRWADVDLDEGTARIGASRRIVNRRMEVKGPKTEAGYRTVALGPATVAALRRLRAEHAERRLVLGGAYDAAADLVICKPDGRPYRPDSTSTQFRKFVDAAGLPRTVHTHTLRHSAASFLAAAGGSRPTSRRSSATRTAARSPCGSTCTRLTRTGGGPAGTLTTSSAASSECGSALRRLPLLVANLVQVHLESPSGPRVVPAACLLPLSTGAAQVPRP
jgi:integrase